MTDLRNYNLQLNGSTTLVTETCFKYGVLFAMTEDFHDHRYRKQDTFYCPNGHGQHYIGKSDEQKLREATARETALRDQLAAATRDAEEARAALLRDRARFANGVCPCCNRSFGNVRRHMETKHPDYDVTKVERHTVEFECSCERVFDTLRGLRVHQGRSRHEGWDAPSASRWSAHLTKVGAR